MGDSARRHAFHIRGSYLERGGDDFFNTFAPAGPSGVPGRVRKRHPSSLEAYIFKGGDDPHVIATPLGRVGVAICYDSSLREVGDRLLADDPHLALIPMSAPTPAKTFFYGERRIRAFHASFSQAAVRVARLFGIPCAVSSKWGAWDTTFPGLIEPAIFKHRHSRFHGITHIGEGVAMAALHLDPDAKRGAMWPERDRFRPWIFEVSGQYGDFRFFEALGRRWYAKRVANHRT